MVAWWGLSSADVPGRYHPGVATFVFFHAHPDDEAIFTGGTIAALVDQGHRCVLVTATTGAIDHPATANGLLGAVRSQETEAACHLLGVARRESLGYSDSGIAPEEIAVPGTAFVVADVDHAAQQVADLLLDERATALVYYDEGGIYAHGDHLMVHRVGRRAAELAAVPTVYEATVDREYLHFVDTHLVDIAALALHPDDQGARSTGVPTVMISVTADVSPFLSTKREAMAAHRSQLPDSADIWKLDPEMFRAVYGFEWFIRSGARTALDELGM